MMELITSAPMTRTFLCAPALDELGADLQRVGKAGAGGGEVEAPGAGGAELVLHEAGGGRERACPGVTVATMMTSTSVGWMPRAARQLRGGFDGKVAGGDALVDEVAFADAGALDDPLVVGVDHFFEVGVGQQAGRNVGSDGRNLWRERCARGFNVRLKTSPQPFGGIRKMNEIRNADHSLR